MKDNFEKAFQAMLREEGGFSNDPIDPGGITNLGVTMASWEQYLGRQCSVDEMRALTPDVVRPHYRSVYWNKVRGDDLPSGVDLAVFDFGVNSGVSRSSKYLQRIVGVTDDGVVGNWTIAAVNKMDGNEIIIDLCNARMAFLQGLSTFPHFGAGWTYRVNRIERLAKSMVA